MLENQQVQRLVPYAGKSWIGLYRNWSWADGSNSSFSYWGANEPNNVERNENCVAANFAESGQWQDWNCDYRRAFVCYSESPVSNQVTLKLKVVKNSSVDLNDSAVMEDMLQQLKQKLKEQGVNEDIRLSWRKQSDGNVFHKDKEDSKKKKDEL
ncbi:macrophage mannose receptor 1-like [Parambassis ranga]|uniref:Macrophage mannose receptor 1-like n=1 Tax=Parambassis ranga TaxID=210632 RepID=A0A6P7INW6_9TELE|nr:macrophage mannose receptor 1-like [Parambassis ranga]